MRGGFLFVGVPMGLFWVLFGEALGGNDGPKALPEQRWETRLGLSWV